MTAARFDVAAERRRLGGSSAAELRRRYQEIGGDAARSRNREYPVRRTPWAQMVAFGDPPLCNPRVSSLQSANAAKPPAPAPCHRPPR